MRASLNGGGEGGVRPIGRTGTSASSQAAAPQERSFADHAPGTGGVGSEIVILDGDGVIVAVNQAWRETVAAYGVLLPNAGIGAAYVEVARRFLPDLDLAVLDRSLGRLASGQSDRVEHTYAIRTPRGPRWRHVQITPLSLGSGGRFVAIHDDLTAQVTTQEQLQTTSAQLFTARDDERQRIAVELHDSTSQHLAAISMAVAKLRRASPLRQAGEIIDEIAHSVNEVVKETRALSYLMRPREIGRGGLTVAVRQFLEGFAQRTGLEASLEADEDGPDGAPALVQHAALRIIQEAASNSYRHGQVRRVVVGLSVEDRVLTVTVTDDGRGLSSGNGEPALGVGIPGMRARAEQLSGRFEISSDETGVRVTAALPLGSPRWGR